VSTVHSCATLVGGSARCWGDNSSGQLGDGTTDDAYEPVTVTGLSGAVAIDTGTSHGCAVLGNGNAACWGWNGVGQLGDGTTTDSPVPVNVTAMS
jgi:alpha-tubulin suppressor-like RCC1 family protein